MRKEKFWEIRDPIYGFIEINEWEREIINHPVFHGMAFMMKEEKSTCEEGMKKNIENLEDQ